MKCSFIKLFKTRINLVFPSHLSTLHKSLVNYPFALWTFKISRQFQKLWVMFFSMTFAPVKRKTELLNIGPKGLVIEARQFQGGFLIWCSISLLYFYMICSLRVKQNILPFVIQLKNKIKYFIILIENAKDLIEFLTQGAIFYY